MIRAAVDWALRNRLPVVVLFSGLMLWGVYSFHELPVEAYPDVAAPWVQVISQWPGHAAEEVEQQITVPVETSLNGVANVTHMRSISLFGLSVVTLTFDDSAQDLLSRHEVAQRISSVSLPANVNPQLSPDTSATGQIQFYTLVSENPAIGLMELKSLEDWVVEKNLKTVPGVVDVNGFGGLTRQYQVNVDPVRLNAYGLGLPQVENALAANNTNSGGSFIEQGAQAFDIRGLGLMESTDAIGDTVVGAQNGTPVRVRDVATVEVGNAIRLGQIGKTIHYEDGRLVNDDDVVEGIVCLHKGDDAEPVLKLLHAEEDRLNTQILPHGVRLVPYLDRSDLMALTTHTVLDNLAHGMLLVIVILFLLLGNLRSAVIVAVTIPFSLLFAAACLRTAHVPANLLSLGALDFGMVVDGSVVMVENILRRMQEAREMHGDHFDPSAVVVEAVRQVQKPVFFSVLIIIVAYLPIFTLQEVEGKLFRPMALTVSFALLGALLFALLAAPVLCLSLFGKSMREWENPLMGWLRDRYRTATAACVDHPRLVTAAALLVFAGVGAIVWSGAIGSEFLPHLDEGAIWARGTLESSTGPTAAGQIMRQARLIFSSFPEVTASVSQMGRPDDGTDTAGFSNTEYFIGLKPREQWRPQFPTKNDLIAAMDEAVSKIPGVDWNFSQPIQDNVDEAVSGVKGELAVKIVGPDLRALEDAAAAVQKAMAPVPGVADLGIFHELGQPNINLEMNRPAAARWGINVADVQDAIEAGIGGKAVTQVLQGEERYDLVVRYQAPYRDTLDALRNIRVLAPGGERVALSQLANIYESSGASNIYRESNARYIAIKYSVRGRDLGSTVRDAQAAVNRLRLPAGYRVLWEGEYASEQRANQRLAVIVPLTVLVIFFILYAAFGSSKWALLILSNVLMATTGGVLALLVTGTHFSVSSGVGFLAVFGVSVLTGVVMISYINQLRLEGQPIRTATVEGAVLLLRPILITVLVASLGLLPAAMSHGIGSDAQRPFAVVVVGGLLVDLFMAVFLVPAWYGSLARDRDKLA